jgi:hypothetical protein
VTVRSSLILNNQLPETVEVKLENTCIHPGGNINQKIGEDIKDLNIIVLRWSGCLIDVVNMSNSCIFSEEMFLQWTKHFTGMQMHYFLPH